MSRLETSGLAGLLPELLKTKVYAGISAGSMVASRSLDLSSSQLIYDEDLDRMEDAAGLGLVDFYFFPHLNSPHFPHVRQPQIAAFAKERGEAVYALDDDSALKIEDDRIELISEGESLIFNEC
jgi:dipeptidase E